MECPEVYSDSCLLDEILYGAARAFFVSAYVDYCEDQRDTEGSCDLPMASSCEDWMDFAPDPPPYAYALAGMMIIEIEQANPAYAAGIYSIAQAIEKTEESTDIDWQNFGHCMAMETMGSGVSWWDDHKRIPLDVPYREVSFFNFDPQAYHSGE